MKNEMKQAIERHGLQLLAIFPNANEQDPIKLCKKLRRLEVATNRSATDYCNGDIDSAAWTKIAYAAKKKMQEILGLAKGCDYSVYFVNGDPRGYSLKIGDEHMRRHGWKLHTDWGGYGIIAPDLTPRNEVTIFGTNYDGELDK